MTANPVARTTDPETSHEAATSARRSAETVMGRVYRILAAANKGMTHDQIISEYRRQAARLGWKPASDSGIRTRVGELVKAGDVEQVLHTRSRSKYGREAALWRAVGV